MSKTLCDRRWLQVSRHCGPAREDGGSRVRYVIDKMQGEGAGRVELGWQEAREVLHALLLDMLGGELEERHPEDTHHELVWNRAGDGLNRGGP